jgi:hypothetical protein
LIRIFVASFSCDNLHIVRSKIREAKCWIRSTRFRDDLHQVRSLTKVTAQLLLWSRIGLYIYKTSFWWFFIKIVFLILNDDW